MDDDFEIANDIIPKIQVKTGDEVQKFHDTWYRGKNINFIPSKDLLSKKDAFEKFILRGYKPNLPIISKSTVVTAFGSCFAHNISNWLLNHGYNILGKKLSLNSHLVRFGEGIVNTFAILEQLEWALENKSLHKGLWFGKNKEIALPDDDIKKKMSTKYNYIL